MPEPSVEKQGQHTTEPVVTAADPHLRRGHFEEFKEAMLSAEAIEEAGRSSRTFAAFSPTSPQTWEAVSDSDKARIRETARIYIGAAAAKAQELLKGGEDRESCKPEIFDATYEPAALSAPQVTEEDRGDVERLRATALRLDCVCPARSDERLGQHADECPMGIAHRLIASLDREECDCDPDYHIAKECRKRGCRADRDFAAPDVERLGGEEGKVEYRLNEADGIHGPFPYEHAVTIHRQLSQDDEAPRPPVIETRCVGTWRPIDESPPPPQEHFKGGGEEPVKRLSEEEIEQVAADAARKAAPIFAAEGWEWWSVDGGSEIPGEDRIRDTIARLARDAQERMNDNGGWICTGRFYVAVDVEDGQEMVSVLLMLTMNDGELIASSAARPASTDAEAAISVALRNVDPLSQPNQGSDQPEGGTSA